MMKKKTMIYVLFVLILVVAIPGKFVTADDGFLLWQVGTPDGSGVTPVVGADEYPATRAFSTVFNYNPVGTALEPEMPGYIGPKNVCEYTTDGRACTDTTAQLNLNFSLDCNYENVEELFFYYDRYGSEYDELFFDIEIDSEFFARIAATENKFGSYIFDMVGLTGLIEKGDHTITVKYAGGGDGNGHYIDYMKLVSMKDPAVCKNQPPEPDAGGPYYGEIGTPVSIVGSATDPDLDPITVLGWSVNNSHCTISNGGTLTPTVTCTDKGTFTLTLTVSDGIAAPVSNTATVNVTDPLLTSSIDDCSFGSYNRYKLIETKFVSSLGTSVTTSSFSNPEEMYLIEASGVFYAGGLYTYDIRADAKYAQDGYQRINTPLIWTDFVHNNESGGEELLELKIDKNFVEWGEYNSNHRYTLLKQGTGLPVQFEFNIYDTYPSNNHGGLCVGIYEFENEAPIANPDGPYLEAVSTDITFDGSDSSDTDNDPLKYAWDFGDGYTGTGVTPTHSYTTAGIYDVCLTVNDGYIDSQEVCTIAVVYDPSAGFVTGGGWIDSPVNNDYLYMQNGGKATFGFVAKYKKGTIVPDGNTEFQFKTGDLNFKSTSYEWLVIAGTKAQYKGEGTINGEGIYKFMITADDDIPDTFRIKIWTEMDGVEEVVYDNGSQQALGSGSVVIHK